MLLFKNKTIFIYLLLVFSYTTKSQVFLSLPIQQNQYKLYIVGERHELKNEEYMFDMIMQTYKNNNVRKAFIELPKEYELEANKFLLDTAGTVVNMEFSGHIITYYHEVEFLNFLNKLRLFNKQIKDSTNKIQLIFSDITFSIYNGLYKIGRYKPLGETENQEIVSLLSKIGSVKLFFTRNNISKKRIKRVNKLKQLVDNYPNDFKNLYLSDYDEMVNQINFLYKTQKVYIKYKSHFPDSIRERFIFENFYNAYKKNPNINYFAEYGNSHVVTNYNVKQYFLTNYNELIEIENSMCTLLNNTPELKGKICNMLYYYNEIYPNTSKPYGAMKIHGRAILTDAEMNKYKNSTSKYLFIPVAELEQYQELKENIKMLIFINQ